MIVGGARPEASALMGGAEVVPSTGRSARRVAPAEVAARSRPQPQRKQRQRKRRNKFLRRKIDNVATEKSLQKRAARRFPLSESGGRPAYHHGDEARQEIARPAHCLHCDGKVAVRCRLCLPLTIR